MCSPLLLFNRAVQFCSVGFKCVFPIQLCGSRPTDPVLACAPIRGLDVLEARHNPVLLRVALARKTTCRYTSSSNTQPVHYLCFFIKALARPSDLDISLASQHLSYPSHSQSICVFRRKVTNRDTLFGLAQELVSHRLAAGSRHGLVGGRKMRH